MEAERIKQLVIARVEALQDQLWGIAKSLYAHPELAFQEFKSAALLTETLSQAGFQIEMGVGGLETAFRATKTGVEGGPSVAFLAEYDALPGLGHACGHNLIASTAVGAGLAMLEVIDELQGEVQVIGTPAEEGGGGKVILANAGVFDGLGAAMMIHPARKNMVNRKSLASARLKLEFFGKPSHAAALPEKGINALDALLLTFNNINALRLQLLRTDRVAGIITEGGKAANIIPDYTSAEFSVRGHTSSRRGEVMQRVIACAEAGALASGCRLEYQVNEGYDNILPNQVIGGLFSQNLTQLGRVVEEPLPDEPMGSTDMGNVSQVVPGLHPYLSVTSEDIPGHTIEFREVCITPAGLSVAMDGAKALAMTAVDLLATPSFLEQAWVEFRSAVNGS
jgi:amidohydrolase